MDQDTAKRLLREGATFIFLDVPEGTEFGIDMKSWNTGERFRGVKMIPPGVHYIFYSSVDNLGETAPRIGFMHEFHKGEVVVKRWDKEVEDISSHPVPEAEIVSLKESMQALDNFLGPYPFDIMDKWNALTSHINDNLICKLTPKSGSIRSALELSSNQRLNKNSQPESEGPSTSKYCRRGKINSAEDREDDLLPDLIPKCGTELQLTKIPDKHFPDGATAAQITQHCMDSSYALEQMISTYKEPIDLLGELEFVYVCFLVGHSLEAFEHWKKLVSLFCSCEVAIKKYRKLYDDFISLLEIQVKEIPEEFLADIVSNNNFVYVKLRHLFRSVEESTLDGRLKTKVERFKKKLTETYQWDFTHLNSDDEDDAPVVVELSDEQTCQLIT